MIHYVRHPEIQGTFHYADQSGIIDAVGRQQRQGNRGENQAVLGLSQPPSRCGTQSSSETVASISNVFVQVLHRLRRGRIRLGIWRFRRAGIAIGDDCQFADIPGFGSHPYLITLGRNVAMAAHVTFITKDGGTHVFQHLERYRKVIKYGRINILDNCVIGERVILLPGVTIGPDSVVAAGSVVARSIPPGVLAAGNPARPVMTVHQYAEWSLAATPDYDEEEYARNEKASLMRMRMRGSVPKRFHREYPNATHD